MIVAGFLEAMYNGKSVGCFNGNCRNTIRTGDTYLIDTWAGQQARPLCAACGQGARYHRKKAVQRGEIKPPEFHGEAG